VQLWEYVLGEDQRNDLSDLDSAQDWIRAQPWGVFWRPTWWTPRARENWGRNLLALRSLARRLKGRRLRHPAPKGEDHDREADAVAFGYLGLMHPSVHVKDESPGVLTASNFLGVRLSPTVVLDGRRTAFFEDPAHFWFNDFDFFWQVVFHSLLVGSGPATCQECGALLGDTTPKNRPKKQRLCDRCRWRRWRKKQPAEKMRARWRDDYKKRTGGSNDGT
jgi:hypothetical protein